MLQALVFKHREYHNFRVSLRAIRRCHFNMTQDLIEGVFGGVDQCRVIFELDCKKLMQLFKGFPLFLRSGSVQTSDKGKDAHLAPELDLEGSHILLMPRETSYHVHSFVVVLLQLFADQLCEETT